MGHESCRAESELCATTPACSVQIGSILRRHATHSYSAACVQRARSRHAERCCDQAPWSEWTTTRVACRTRSARVGGSMRDAGSVVSPLKSQGTGAGTGAGPGTDRW